MRDIGPNGRLAWAKRSFLYVEAKSAHESHSLGHVVRIRQLLVVLDCCFYFKLVLYLQNVRFAFTKRSCVQALRRHHGAQIEVQERLK